MDLQSLSLSFNRVHLLYCAVHTVAKLYWQIKIGCITYVQRYENNVPIYHC
jgi:hypothetical protein